MFIKCDKVNGHALWGFMKHLPDPGEFSVYIGVGGRTASGLQGEYVHVGRTPDLLGGLGLIAGTRSQSDLSGSVYLCACFIL